MVLLGFVCVVVIMGVGLDRVGVVGAEWHWRLLIVVEGGWGRKEEVVVGGVDGGCVQVRSSVAQQRLC